MFKKLEEKLRKVRDENFNTFLAVVAFCGIIYFLIEGIIIYFSNYLSYLVVKIPYFNHFDRDNVSYALALAFILILCLLIFYLSLKWKKAEKELEEQQLSKYKEKYQYYVNLVQSVLLKPEYKSIALDDTWGKTFERYIKSLAHTCKSSQIVFTDFDVASCLFCSLMTAVPRAEKRKKRICNFAFNCVQPLISEPRAYEVSFLSGGEVYLEETDHSKKADLSILYSTYGNAWLIAMLGSCFYSNSLRHSSTLAFISDFFNMLYQRCCR